MRAIRYGDAMGYIYSYAENASQSAMRAIRYGEKEAVWQQHKMQGVAIRYACN